MSLDKATFVILFFLFAKFILFFVLPYFIFWRWFPNNFKKFKIQNPERQKPQIKHELKYSILALFIQTMVLLLIYWGMQEKIFNIYLGFGSRGFLNEILAFIFYILIYDFYFYGSHRILHQDWLYKNVHLIHHRSLNPTPFASLSFHPLEALINLLYLFPIAFFFPMSLEMFIFLLVITDIGNLMGHLGYELLPRHSRKSWWGRWLTTPTHHNMHHQYSKSNFGLYWKGWDELFKTTHPRTEEEFYRVKDQKSV